MKINQCRNSLTVKLRANWLVLLSFVRINTHINGTKQAERRPHRLKMCSVLTATRKSNKLSICFILGYFLINVEM